MHHRLSHWPFLIGSERREGRAASAQDSAAMIGSLRAAAASIQAAPLPLTSLDSDTLGSAIPTEATHGEREESKPFACAVRIVVHDQSIQQAVEQGDAIIREVQASLERGLVSTSTNKARAVLQYVLWEQAAHSFHVEPTKSNNILWLSKAWSTKVDPLTSWPPQKALLLRVLPHAHSWVRVLELAREDGGIDIKDDCRIEDFSAKCHQDGNNCIAKGSRPLIRLAINVSHPASRRSLDYLRMDANGRCVDGAEREELRLCSISQHEMWRGAAQTTAGYVDGVSSVCHSSSAGDGPCLKRIITVFALPEEHPFAGLSAVQRLLRVGIEVHAIDRQHMLSGSLSNQGSCGPTQV